MSAATETLIFDQEIKKAALVLRALNHPLRRKILFLLDRKKELNVTEIYTTLRIEQSVASAQLSVLREAGVVRYERKGLSNKYYLDVERLAAINQLANELAFPKRP